MTLPREALEDVLSEGEYQHRWCHAILRLKKLYFLWRESEIAGLDKVKRYVLPKRMGVDEGGKAIVKTESRIVVFELTEFDKITPTMYGYRFVGFGQKDKS